MLPLFSCAMIPEKQAQKFHTDDASLPRTGKWFWLVMPHGKLPPTNQKHYADLGSDASSVWNFCTCFLDVILQGNQGRHHEMLVIFSGYMLLWIWNLGSNSFKVLTFQDAMYCSVVNTNNGSFIHLIMVNQRKWVHALFKIHRRLLQLYVCRNLNWLKHQ